MSAPLLERVQSLPYHGTITRRKELAQKIRHALQDYRQHAGWDAGQDRGLERIEHLWRTLLELEGVERTGERR